MTLEERKTDMEHRSIAMSIINDRIVVMLNAARFTYAMGITFVIMSVLGLVLNGGGIWCLFVFGPLGLIMIFLGQFNEEKAFYIDNWCRHMMYNSTATPQQILECFTDLKEGREPRYKFQEVKPKTANDAFWERMEQKYGHKAKPEITDRRDPRYSTANKNNIMVQKSLEKDEPIKEIRRR